MMYMIPSLEAFACAQCAIAYPSWTCDGRHHSAGAEHEVARPAERVLAGRLWPVAADRGEWAEPPVDRVLHGGHAGRDVAADHRGLRVELGEQALDRLPLALERGDHLAQARDLGPRGPVRASAARMRRRRARCRAPCCFAR